MKIAKEFNDIRKDEFIKLLEIKDVKHYTEIEEFFGKIIFMIPIYPLDSKNIYKTHEIDNNSYT